MKNLGAEELQDGARVWRGDHFPPHKYIRNTSTRGTTPTEHLLNTGRRPQTSQKAEEQISELEDKIVETTTAEQNKEKRMKRIEESLRDLWDNIKHTNIRIIGVPEEEE